MSAVSGYTMFIMGTTFFYFYQNTEESVLDVYSGNTGTILAISILYFIGSIMAWSELKQLEIKRALISSFILGFIFSVYYFSIQFFNYFSFGPDFEMYGLFATPVLVVIITFSMVKFLVKLAK